jgi:hypothetical protein
VKLWFVFSEIVIKIERIVLFIETGNISYFTVSPVGCFVFEFEFFGKKITG